MDGKDFVRAIKELVKNSAVTTTIKNLESPPGRKPSEELVTLSSWYKQLDDTNKGMVKRVLDVVTDSSVFGFLAVLDGVRVIEDSSDKGDFELYYINNENRELLNDPEEEYLHDIYKSLE